MKKILLLLVLIPYFSNGQIQYKDDGSIYFDKVYQVDLEKEEIKSKVNEWMALNFNDSNNVIKMNTDDIIIANGVLNISHVYGKIRKQYDFDFSLITEFKEGRYKILIDKISSKDGIVVINKNFMSKNDYKIYSLAIAKELGMERRMKKILDKNDKLTELYEKAIKMNGAILEKFSSKIEAMAESLNTHVQKTSINNEDW